MKQKNHKFLLVVKTTDTRYGAWLEVMSAFAQRKPDNCEFHLRKSPPKKSK